MGKIKECKISRDRDVYRPGENISGQVTLVVEGDVKARSVNIFCCGMALTKWRGAFQRSYESDNCSKEIYVNLVIRKAVQNLTSGNHQYVYNFNLPSQGLPSSFEGHYGSIRYFLRVEVDKPFPSINNHFYSSFTVLAHLDANLPVYKKVASASVKKQLSKVLGLGNAGNLHLSASIDRNGYCPGEVILINMEARNESSKDCGAVKASLVQYVHYKASSDTNRETNVIRTLLDQKLEKGQNRIWHQQRLPIDPVPPSLKQLTCQIIKVTYSLNIEIEVPLGIDLALSFPLKICTVPLGKHVEEKPVPVKPGALEIPGSKSVKYVQCTAGYKIFLKSDGDFACVRYIPMTALATNYQPEQTSLGACAMPAEDMQTAKSQQQFQGFKPPASPMSFNEPPPSYEESVKAEALMSTTYSVAPNQAEKGSVMVLLFATMDTDQVRMGFKKNKASLELQGGHVLAFQSNLTLLPAVQTGAIFIYFKSALAGSNWFYNMRMFDPDMTSRLWVLQGYNKFEMGKPSTTAGHTALTVLFLKRISEFQPSSAYTAEQQKLLKEVLNPTKKRFGGKTVVSSNDLTIISGDWTSLMASADGVTMVVTQWPSVQHNEDYKAQFNVDNGLIRYNELFEMAYNKLASLVFEVGDISYFD